MASLDSMHSLTEGKPQISHANNEKDIKYPEQRSNQDPGLIYLVTTSRLRGQQRYIFNMPLRTRGNHKAPKTRSWNADISVSTKEYPISRWYTHLSTHTRLHSPKLSHDGPWPDTQAEATKPILESQRRIVMVRAMRRHTSILLPRILDIEQSSISHLLAQPLLPISIPQNSSPYIQLSARQLAVDIDHMVTEPSFSQQECENAPHIPTWYDVAIFTQIWFTTSSIFSHQMSKAIMVDRDYAWGDIPSIYSPSLRESEPCSISLQTDDYVSSAYHFNSILDLDDSILIVSWLVSVSVMQQHSFIRPTREGENHQWVYI